MKRKTILFLLTALMLLVLCACGTTAEVDSDGNSSESIATSTPKPTPTPKTIGQKTESETEVSLEVKNYTGEAITSWRIKLTGEEDFSENLLGDDIFLQNGSRVLYVDPENHDANRFCEVEVEFEDVRATIHQFPLDDTDYVELCKEDNVVYLVYQSKTSKKEVNTLDEELAIWEAAQAAEAAKTTTATSSSGSSGYSGGGSSSPGSTGSGSSGASEPVSGGGSDSSGGSDSGDDGCIGDDGLLY